MTIMYNDYHYYHKGFEKRIRHNKNFLEIVTWNNKLIDKILGFKKGDLIAIDGKIIKRYYHQVWVLSLMALHISPLYFITNAERVTVCKWKDKDMGIYWNKLYGLNKEYYDATHEVENVVSDDDFAVDPSDFPDDDEV